jgi:hypothetical protein
MKREAYLPLVIAALLLLLVLYVGNYLALVAPYHGLYFNDIPDPPDYRCGGSWSACAFWPLEQIDRRLRPGFWNQEELGGARKYTATFMVDVG